MEAAQRVISQWKVDGVERSALQALLAQADPRDLSHAWFKQPTNFRYSNIGEKFTRVVEDNMGIRPRNVLKLLLSVGVPRSDIDDVWLTELSEFGNERGFIAHRSVAAATLLPDAGRARARVGLILKGLRDVDRSLRSVVRKRANLRSFTAVDDALKGRHEILRRPS